MESIEQLRKQIERVKKKSLEIETTVDVAMSWLDEIEREIAEKYMKLPCDCEGVPIRVGDMMIDKDCIPYIVMSVSATRVYCKDGIWVYPSDCHHVKYDSMEAKTLLPCWYCGGEADIAEMTTKCDGMMFFKALCNDCSCPGANIHMWYKTEAEAIAAWNTRAELSGQSVKVVK